MEGIVKSTNSRMMQVAMRADVSSQLKCLLFVLCMHHNDEVGCAWPSVERLAKLCGNVSARTLQRQLSKLVKLGVLSVQERQNIRSNAYVIQEVPLQAISIKGISWAKNMMGSPGFAQTSVATLATTVTETATPVSHYPDTGVTLPRHQCHPNGGRERKIGTEKGNGGGTDARATPPAAAPATPAAPEPAPSPALFASHLGQPEQPTAGLAKEDRSAEQHAIAQVNAQRVTNGKKPFTLADQRQLAAEAAKANISTLQAVEWILERSSRNFFRADFFVPPVQQPALQAATAPAMPKAAPVPVVLSPEEQAKLEAQAAAAKAKAMALVASWNGTKKSQKDEATTVPKHLTGPAWAVDAVGRYRAGERVGLYALESACSVLKINLKALRAECAKVPVTT